MNTKFRNSLHAGVIATLTATPCWVAAQQVQASHPEHKHYGQLTAVVPTLSGIQPRSLPEGALLRSENTTHSNNTRLSALTPQQLIDIEIEGISGEKIGKVEGVVRSRIDGFIYAVISSGGIFGIGAKEVTVHFEKLEVQGDRLRIDTTKDALQGWPEYQEDQYGELVPSNKPISAFSACEVIPPQGSD
jgi:hypothetical protein